MTLPQMFYLAVLWPILAAVIAAGVVVYIKIKRRRQPSRRGEFEGVVPVNPMTEAQARRMARIYFISAGTVIGLLAATAAFLFVYS